MLLKYMKEANLLFSSKYLLIGELFQFQVCLLRCLLTQSFKFLFILRYLILSRPIRQLTTTLVAPSPQAKRPKVATPLAPFNMNTLYNSKRPQDRLFDDGKGY